MENNKNTKIGIIVCGIVLIFILTALIGESEDKQMSGTAPKSTFSLTPTKPTTTKNPEITSTPKQAQKLTPTEQILPATEKPTPEVKDGTVLVTRVIDGDTIEIEGGQKIRYVGIDTPETVDPRKPVQCFGAEASNRNKQLVGGKRVLLEKDITEIDKYGRLVRYVYVDGTFINLVLVQEGFASSYTYPPDVKYQNQFTEAERIAREQKKGLWGSCPVSTQEQPMPAPTPTSSACKIKGNISSSGKIYHLEGCGSYNQTIINETQGERWFCAEEEATTAGWRKAKNCP